MRKRGWRSLELRAKSKEYRVKSKEHRAESKEQGVETRGLNKKPRQRRGFLKISISIILWARRWRTTYEEIVDQVYYVIYINP
jgi:hypothetical protein